jgi:acetyl-CoA carboxylase alpha subunit
MKISNDEPSIKISDQISPMEKEKPVTQPNFAAKVSPAKKATPAKKPPKSKAVDKLTQYIHDRVVIMQIETKSQQSNSRVSGKLS